MRLGHILAAIFFFGLVVGMAMLNGANGNYVHLEATFISLVKLFLIGVLASATMVIPGVSGSMMLLLLGYYNPILDTIKEFFSAVMAFDFDGLLATILLLVPFGMGVLVGMVAIAKVIEVIFSRFPMYAYWAIIGLLFASPIAILLVGNSYGITIVSVTTGIIAFGIGLVISKNLGEK